jgi:DNA replication and repair protein RecF
MTLAKLDVSNVRNIESASIAISPRLNVILGPNGSGKTSLLEAIHILGRARSFRTTHTSHITRFNQDDLTVFGKLAPIPDFPDSTIGIRLGKHRREILLGGRKLQSSAELIRVFPVQIIQPSSSGLLDGGPRPRRQFLDWGAFHSDEAYLGTWRSYVRALTQRNALLRSGDLHGLDIWTRELSRYGTMVALARSAYAARLQPLFEAATHYLLSGLAFNLRLSSGWSDKLSLGEAVRNEISQDLRDGYTHSGPHKGDFLIQVNEKPSQQILSRGQIKLLVFALLLAQSHLLEASRTGGGCVLIDDFASELDADNRAKLLQFLHSRDSQIFITAADASLIDASVLCDASVFHMEHGKVTQF